MPGTPRTRTPRSRTRTPRSRHGTPRSRTRTPRSRHGTPRSRHGTPRSRTGSRGRRPIRMQRPVPPTDRYIDQIKEEHPTFDDAMVNRLAKMEYCNLLNTEFLHNRLPPIINKRLINMYFDGDKNNYHNAVNYLRLLPASKAVANEWWTQSNANNEVI
jgi:hypothetical protein